RQTSNVAARSRQTVDKSVGDRVPCRRKHDRYDRCRLLCREDLWGSRRDNNVDLEPDELGRDLSEAIGAAFRPAILDCYGAAFDPVELTSSLPKSGAPLAGRRTRALARKPDGRQLLRLLRPRRERPRRRCAAEQREELAPPHVWMAPAWQEIIWRAAQRSLAVMCPACSRSPDGLLALMESA